MILGCSYIVSGVAVSMSCLTLTFLLYSFLPQLRDLTGKFILGICSFLTTNYALRLVDVNMLVGFKVREHQIFYIYFMEKYFSGSKCS